MREGHLFSCIQFFFTNRHTFSTHTVLRYLSRSLTLAHIFKGFLDRNKSNGFGGGDASCVFLVN